MRAVSKVRDQKFLTKVAKDDAQWRVREAAVKHIVSRKVLKDISINDDSEYVRNVAKKRMSL